MRIANACTNPDLFWALKGGGGGTFGVVTRVTLRTHELPASFGGVAATIEASSDSAFRRLLGRFVEFYAASLFDPRWGEIANVRPRNRLDIQMSSLGLDRQQAEAIWQPFLGWVAAAPGDFTFTTAPVFRSIPARHRWDPAFLKTYVPAAVRSDDRPGASEDNIFWSANVSEAGHFIHGFESAWLPASLLRDDRRLELTDALIAAARHSTVEIHFQKGLAGGAAEVAATARDTATNPAVIDAFALAIIASEGRRHIRACAATSRISGTRDATPRRSRRPWPNSGGSRRMPVPMLRKAVTSRPTGKTPTGARTTRGCSR